MEHIIVAVEPESIASELGLEPGDAIVEINHQPIVDIFDYQYLIDDDYIQVLVHTKDGQECVLEIEKDEEEDLGLAFASSLMDDYRSCRNKCIFCFIDQMPPGMRETLYFKDDDSRLSFLQGNYITLTNMKDEEIDRVIRYRLAPINVSVHATNPELRCRMLKNRFAGTVMEKLRKFHQAGIPLNAQIVLCKGYNDGAELDRTIADLATLMPSLESLSVVPVGLTKYRDGLPKLDPFTKEDAKKVLSQIHGWQEKLLLAHGSRMVHASDEWYILAEESFPSEDNYEGYLQIENGVGMMRSLIEEVKEYLLALSEGTEGLPENIASRNISIATAKLAFPTIRELADLVTAQFPQVTVDVHCIENHFFGELITVSGLVTGGDLKEQLAGKSLGEELLLPCNMLRSGESVFLDDVTVEELGNSLQIKVNIVESDGRDFVDRILGICEDSHISRLNPYEI